MLALGAGVLAGTLACLVAAIQMFYASLFGGDYEQIPTDTWEYVPWYALPSIAGAAGVVAVWGVVRWGQERGGATLFWSAIAVSVAAAVGWWEFAGWLVSE